MAKLANTPREASVLELEQRKSFAVSIAFEEPNGAPIDLTNAVVVFTAALPAGTLERTATIAMPAAGVAVVSLQAADLAVEPGSYPFAVTLRVSGYSLVVVKGELRVLANPETSSTSSTYAGAGSSAGLLAQLRGLQVIRVTTTAGIPGGTGSGLDATGVAAGRVPTALGDGTWEWRVLPAPRAEDLTGTLSPDRIANWSLRQNKITQATPDNLLPNGMFEQGGKLYPWTQDPRFVWQTEDRPPVGNAPPGAIVTQAGLGTNTLFDTEPYQAGFALEHGVAYEFEMWIKADKPNSRLYVEVRDENGAQAMNWTAVEGGAGASSYPVSNWTVPTEWTRVVSRGIPTPNPATKRSRARMGSWYLNHANGTERTASYTIAGVRIRRAQAANFNARLYGTTTADAAVVDDLQANLELRVGPADSRLSLAYGTVSATESGTPVPVYMPTGVEGLPTPTAVDQAAPKGYVDDLIGTVVAGTKTGNKLVGLAENIVNSGYVASSTAANVIVHTINVIAGQRYRVAFTGMHDGTVAADVVTIQLWAGASIMLQQYSGRANSQNASTSQGFFMEGYWVATVTGPVQFRATLARAIGTGSVRIIASPSYPMSLSIEQMDETSLDVAWTDVTTFAADWRNLVASSYGPVRYRIQNGMCHVVGPAQTTVARSGGTSYLMLTLPSSCWPKTNMQIPAFSAQINGTGIVAAAFSTYMCFVGPTGGISIYPAITGASMPANAYVFINGSFPLN